MNITDEIAHEIPQWPAGHDVSHVVSGWEIKFHSPVFTVVVRSKVKDPTGISWTGDMTKYNTKNRSHDKDTDEDLLTQNVSYS